MSERRDLDDKTGLGGGATVIAAAVIVACGFIVVWVFKTMWETPAPEPERNIGARVVPKMPLFAASDPGVVADLGDLSVRFPKKPALATESIAAPAGTTALEVRAYRGDARDVETWSASFAPASGPHADAGAAISAAEDAIVARLRAMQSLDGARVTHREDSVLAALPARDLSLVSDTGYCARALVAVAKSGRLYTLVVIEPTSPADAGSADLDPDANAFFATARPAPAP